MKKIVLALSTVGLLAAGALYLRFDHMVRSAIEFYGPRLTQTSVTVRRVNLSPFSGKGRLSGVEIGSPKGFDEPYVFRLGEVRVTLDVRSLASDTIVIKEVVLEGPEVHYELSGGGSNFSQLQRNVASFSPPSSDPAAKPKKLRIDRFVARNGKVYANLLGVKTALPLSEVTLTGIGAGSGASIGQAAAQILGSLSASAVGAVSGGQAEKVLDGATKMLKGLFGK